MKSMKALTMLAVAAGILSITAGTAPAQATTELAQMGSGDESQCKQFTPRDFLGRIGCLTAVYAGMPTEEECKGVRDRKVKAKCFKEAEKNKRPDPKVCQKMRKQKDRIECSKLVKGTRLYLPGDCWKVVGPKRREQCYKTARTAFEKCGRKNREDKVFQKCAQKILNAAKAEALKKEIVAFESRMAAHRKKWLNRKMNRPGIAGGSNF